MKLLIPIFILSTLMASSCQKTADEMIVYTGPLLAGVDSTTTSLDIFSPEITIGKEDTRAFDLNGDGLLDFEVKGNYWSDYDEWQFETWHQDIICLHPGATYSHTGTPGTGVCVLGLDVGTAIDESLPWISYQSWLAYVGHTLDGLSYHGCIVDEGLTYLGLRVETSSDTTYGWLEVEFPGTSGAIYSLGIR